MRHIYFILFSISLCSCGPSLEDIEKMPEENRGQALYEKFCLQCHGGDGDLGSSGAPELSKSILSDEEVIEIIKYGRVEKGMPAHENLLGSDKNIVLVKEYIKSFRN